MKFLVDAQLPPALARFLVSLGENAIHVLDAGLLEATDSEIWDFAIQNDWVIISKDEDFSFRAAMTSSPPRIIWVRVGNCSKQRLIAIFTAYWESIRKELNAGALLVEIA